MREGLKKNEVHKVVVVYGVSESDLEEEEKVLDLDEYTPGPVRCRRGLDELGKWRDFPPPLIRCAVPTPPSSSLQLLLPPTHGDEWAAPGDDDTARVPANHRRRGAGSPRGGENNGDVRP
ncbi:unnamed protein product [Merluccius merluccius]